MNKVSFVYTMTDYGSDDEICIPRIYNVILKVLPGLYVGSVRDSKDQEQLEANGITHILSVHDNAKKGVNQVSHY